MLPVRRASIIKPTLGETLNYGHPLLAGLAGCWPFNEAGPNGGSGGGVSTYQAYGARSLINPNDLLAAYSINAGCLWQAGPQPVGMTFGPNGNGGQTACGNVLKTPSAPLVSTSAITVFWFGFVMSANASAGGFPPLAGCTYNAFANSSPYVCYGVHIHTTNQLYFFDSTGGSNNAYSGGVTVTDGIPFSAAYSIQSGIQTGYYNGRKVIGETHSGAISYGAAPYIYSNVDAGGSNSTGAQTSLILIWNRVLSAAEHQMLADNPWCMFTPQNRVFGWHPGSSIFNVSVSIGAKGGFSASEALRAPLSVSIGGEAGFSTVAGGRDSVSIGGIAGYGASCKLLLPVSVSIGAKGGITTATTYPQTITIGGEAHFGLTEHLHAPLAIALGTTAGFKAFSSGSVPSTYLIVFTITDPGATYTSPPTVTVVGSNSVTSAGTFTAVLGAAGTAQAGQVIGITVQNTGNAGSLTGPLTVTLSGGGGSGATATASLQTQQSLTASQQQPFQVRAEGYGVLTIETLVVAAQATLPLNPPPIRQPVIQQTPPGASAGTNAAVPQQQQPARGETPNVHSRPWNQFFEQLYQNALNPAQQVQFLCPSVDETDSEWYAQGTVDGSTDPVTFNATMTGQSRFGIEAQVIQGGTGYSGATVLTFSGTGNSGFGAVLTPIIEMGAIVGITVVSSGYGYVPPVSLVATDTGGGSGALLAAELGRQFGIGDYILWNDQTITAGVRSYEIDQITAIVPIDATHATFTLARRASGAPADQAQYGSAFVGHSNAAFYRLINKLFIASANPAPGPQVLKFPWDNMTVAAVTAALPQEAPITVNLSPTVYLPGTTTLDPRVNPPTPGLRTMNGAAYTNLGILGAVSVGQTSQARVSVQAHESIRTVYAKVTVAPTGATPFNGDANACIVIYVCYISPGGVVGLIDTLVIDATEFNSYSASNVPDGRQMPYHALWPFTAPNTDWPPNRLPQCAGALTAGGLLQLPITPSGSSTVLFTPDGAIDFIVAQVGTSTAGSNLTVCVQT